jgi:predicted porin
MNVMKKSLLTLAVLGAFAGTAFAQSNVTIYGVVDVGFSHFDNAVVTTNRIDSGIQSGSRIGFRGVEDLGGGLSAIFTLENGFNADNGTFGQPTSTGATRLFGRQAFVGLNSGYGALKFGRQINPIRNALEAIDPFVIGLAGDATKVFSVYGDRADNTINYSLPATVMGVSGLKGEFAYSLGEQAGSTSLGRQFGLSVGYAAGPFSAVLAYHDQNLLVGTADAGQADTVFLGGTWDFGLAKLHAAYAVNKGETALGNTNLDHDDMMLGVSAPIGAGRILASYMRRSDDIADARDTDVWSLGYTYDLSKRTNLYTSYARTKNDTLASLGGAAAAGGDPSTFNVGIRHRF